MAQCEGYCLMCNTIMGIRAMRKFWDDLARKGLARTKPSAIRSWKIRRAKREFVNKKKIGRKCPCCDLKCTKDNVEGFVFAHLPEFVNKKHLGPRGSRDGGVAGLVNTNHKLSTVRSKLVAEIAMCRLMCANCHKIRDTDNGL